MSNKSISKTKRILKNRVKEIQHEPTAEVVKRFNITLVGIQNYYRYATTIYMDLTDVKYALLKSIKARLKKNATTVKFSETSVLFRKKTKGIKHNTKIFSVQEVPLLPVRGVHHKNPWNFSQSICKYTRAGRSKVHKGLKAIPRDVLTQVMNTYSKNRSISTMIIVSQSTSHNMEDVMSQVSRLELIVSFPSLLYQGQKMGQINTPT
jgi:hypothetical protein